MEQLPEENLVKVAGKILCCECGTPIDPNPANLCVACLRTQVDITEGIPKQVRSILKNVEMYFKISLLGKILKNNYPPPIFSNK